MNRRTFYGIAAALVAAPLLPATSAPAPILRIVWVWHAKQRIWERVRMADLQPGDIFALHEPDGQRVCGQEWWRALSMPTPGIAPGACAIEAEAYNG